jgi:hypothetical protein
MVSFRWWKVVRDGDDTVGNPPPAPPPAPKTFSQADLDKILGDERRKMKQRSDQLATQLEDLQKKSGLTQQEKDDLAAQVDQLRTENLTKEEQLKSQYDKDMKKAKKDNEEAVRDRDDWKNRYTTAEIRRAITDASVGEKARSVKPIIALLQPLTHLVQVIGDDGTPTGDLVPKVKYAEVKDGKTIQLELTVLDAVKKMKENSEYLHLFEGTSSGGLGLSSGSGSAGGSTDPNTPPTDPAKFREWRSKKLGRKTT